MKYVQYILTIAIPEPMFETLGMTPEEGAQMFREEVKKEFPEGDVKFDVEMIVLDENLV
jgi:hypothetical protein